MPMLPGVRRRVFQIGGKRGLAPSRREGPHSRAQFNLTLMKSPGMNRNLSSGAHSGSHLFVGFRVYTLLIFQVIYLHKRGGLAPGGHTLAIELQRVFIGKGYPPSASAGGLETKRTRKINGVRSRKPEKVRARVRARNQ